LLMKNLLALFTFILLSLLGADAKHFAVLVAGSNGFYNYRHQSDIFHAYQLVKKYGVLEEDIILFAFDDIASDPSNPYPGQVFNKPSTGPGEDVYAGIQIDYKGADVTPENFLSALKGDSAAVGGKKVLTSTADDNVFVYFSDHGAVGLVAFPSSYLYANDLISALQYMSTNAMYKELVFYIEACEAGSMFATILPDNINIYTTTASTPDESSWAYYCYPNDTVNGKSIGSCLGDEYSIHFLENLESVDPTTETLTTQYSIIKQETLESHPQQYGQMTIAAEVISHFQADDDSHPPLVTMSEKMHGKVGKVDARAVKLAYLLRRHEQLQTEESKKELEEELYSMEKLDSIFGQLAARLDLDTNMPVGEIDFKCLKQRVSMYEAICGKLSEYGLKYVRQIQNTCAQGVSVYDFDAALWNICN